MIVASPTIPTGQTPQADELAALAYLLAAQWRDGVSVATAWSTDIRHSRSVAEQRLGLLGSPMRTLQVPLLTLGVRDSLSAQMMLMRMGQSKSLVPLYPDTARLTADASGTTIPCDTAHCRFFQGGRVALWRKGRGEASAAFEVLEIDEVDDGFIVTAEPVSGSWSTGDKVTPLIEAIPSLGGVFETENDRVFQGSLGAIEDVGPSMLPPVSPPGELPAGYPVYHGLPVLTLPVHSPPNSRIEVERVGLQTPLGRGTVHELHGDRPRVGFTMNATFLRRDKAWRFLEFFDSRAGSLHPFWVLSPGTDYELSVIASTTMSVPSVGPLHDWNMRPHVGLVLHDGTVLIRGVASADRVGSVDQIEFDEPLPGGVALADVRRVTTARLARFASDEIQEHWTNTEVMETDVSVIELINEDEVAAGVVWPDTRPLTLPWSAAACSGGILDCEEHCADALTLQFIATLPERVTYELDPADFTFPENAQEAGPEYEPWDYVVHKLDAVVERDDFIQVYGLGPDLANLPLLEFGGYVLSDKTGIYWIPPEHRFRVESDCYTMIDNACWELRIVLVEADEEGT